MSKRTSKRAKPRKSGDDGGSQAAPGAAPPDPEKAAVKRLSPVAAMREVLAANPLASVEEIGAELEKLGVPRPKSTIETIRSDFKQTYRALARAGALKKPVL